MNLRTLRMVEPLLAVLGWSVSTSALTLVMIFQGQLLPKNINGGALYAEVASADPVWIWIFYAGSFGICVLAALAIREPGKSLLSFFSSYVGAAVLTYLVLALPDILGEYAVPGALQEAATIFTLTAFFPVLLLVNLAGTIAGISLAERLL